MHANKVRLVRALQAAGWTPDRFGHFHRDCEARNTTTGAIVARPIRVKLQSTSARVERKVAIGDNTEWIKIRSAYYKDINFDLENGTLRLSIDGWLI